MAFTGKLGTPDSRLGNIVLGLAALVFAIPAATATVSAPPPKIPLLLAAPAAHASASATPPTLTLGGIISPTTFTATASSSYSGHPASNAFDGSFATQWLSAGNAPQWLQMAMNSPVAVNAYHMGVVPTLSQGPGSWTFQGSNNNVDVVTVNKSGEYAGTPAVNLFDGNVLSEWFVQTATAWASVQYSAALTPTEYWITSSPTNATQDPKDWVISGSNDGITWTTLDTQTGQTFASRTLTKHYTFANTTAYSQFKININATPGGAAAIHCAELTMGGGASWATLDTRSSVTWADSVMQTFTFTNTVAYAAYRLMVTSNSGNNYVEVARFEMDQYVPPSTYHVPAAHASASAPAPASSLILGGIIFYPPAATATATALPPTVTFGALHLALPSAGATATALPVSINTPGSPLALAAPRAAVTATAPAPALSMALIGWTADQSQRTALELNVTDGVLVVDPPLAVAPDGTGGPGPGGTGGPLVVERMLRRQSHIMPVPTPDADGHIRVSDPWTIIEGDVGVLHVVVSGKDFTYFRGAPTLVDEWSTAEPFGDASAQVTFPQLSPFDVTGTGDLAWLHPGAPVEIFLLDVDGTTRHRRFAGHFISDEGGSSEDAANNVWQAEGALFQADHVGNPVPTILDPTDIGTLISKSLNGVVSARFGSIANVTTGIKSRQRGSLGDSPIDYVQALLGTAWTDDASSQWTVAKKPNTHRQYLLRLKDRTTVHWTVTTGAPGVETALSRDLLSTVTAVYGRGIGPDGYAWAGWCYPRFLDDDAPAYPYSSGATVMSVGDTDAGTLTGHGVTDWQRRVNDLNLTGNVPVDGVYNTSDVAVCRAIQGDYGLLVDGIVGPQTWAGTFAVGSGGGDLTGAYRRPLAIDPRVDPHLYTASGAIDGVNPAYDRSVIRVDRDEDFGAGTTKADATRSAIAELARDKFPGLTGTITLTSDPHEGSRFLIDEGNNVCVLGFRGANPLLHIADLKASPQTHQVTITVDEHARDAMTIAAIMKDTRDAAPDPARRPGAVNRRSRMDQDIAVQFDGESDGGRIPRHALYGGLWTVIRIPVSQMGQIAKLDIKTASPAAKFALALFGAPITPAHLVNLVGDPLSGTNPFARTEAKGIALDDLGLIEAFGAPGSAAGYGRGQEGTGTLTGQLIDTGGLSYISARPPWIWVAEWSPTSTFISGRIYPAPIQ